LGANICLPKTKEAKEFLLFFIIFYYFSFLFFFFFFFLIANLNSLLLPADRQPF